MERETGMSRYMKHFLTASINMTSPLDFADVRIIARTALPIIPTNREAISQYKVGFIEDIIS
jgi:hypothetical protein